MITAQRTLSDSLLLCCASTSPGAEDKETVEQNKNCPPKGHRGKEFPFRFPWPEPWVFPMPLERHCFLGWARSGYQAYNHEQNRAEELANHSLNELIVEIILSNRVFRKNQRDSPMYGDSQWDSTKHNGKGGRRSRPIPKQPEKVYGGHWHSDISCHCLEVFEYSAEMSDQRRTQHAKEH